jgi:hypothetical protein
MQPVILMIVSLLFVLSLVYMTFFRPWQLHCGATDEEIERAMPGDDIVGKPSFNATRAVSIKAPPIEPPAP